MKLTKILHTIKEKIIDYLIIYLEGKGYFIYDTPKIIDAILPNDFFNNSDEKCLYIDRIQNNVIHMLYVYKGEKEFRRNQIINCIKSLK